jgi:hypothetical protein
MVKTLHVNLRLMMLFFLLIFFVDASSPVRTEASIQETLNMRRCLPVEMTSILDYALSSNMTDLHRQFLMGTALECLFTELESGVKPCDAMYSTMNRLINRHQHAMRKYQAEHGDIDKTWQTTLNHLRTMPPRVRSQCLIDVRGKSLVPCMRQIHKLATLKIITHHVSTEVL